MKWIRASVIALVVAPAGLAGPLAAREGSTCTNGNCDAPIFGYSDGYSSDTTWDPAGAAANEATNNCRAQCSPTTCANYNAGSYLSLCTAYTAADMHGAECPSVDVFSTRPNGHDGPTIYYATADGWCPCAIPAGEEPIARGGRVELTTTQKILNTYKRVKQSVFKRLFGGGK